jgi:choline dehydrogenase-like flavoprotein
MGGGGEGRPCASDVYDLSGVTILTHTMIQRIILSSKNEEVTATGVQLVDGKIISATREVIVSCGTYRTPQVLMWSVIGNAHDLVRYGIPLVVDNSEVGRNFHDHLVLCM